MPSRVKRTTTSGVGATAPPAVAIASSSRSFCRDSSSRPGLRTSPETNTVSLRLVRIATTTCGVCDLPRYARSTIAAISLGVLPATWSAPA